MAPCSRCNGFSHKISIRDPREYQDLARQLTEAVTQGTFLLERADCPLQDLFNTPWPADCLRHDFRCTACGRAYQLFADTYHGRASWQPKDLPSS